MDIFECIKKRTSVRRFTQQPIPIEDLQKIISGVRVAPSAANLQPLEYIIINDTSLCDEIFPHLGWAGYLEPSWSPDEDERPTAYIAILNVQPDNIYVQLDIGISMAYIVLEAQALDIASCIICNIKQNELKSILAIPDQVELKALIALGKQNEVVRREERSDTVKYWRDENQVFHVPKKPLSSIMHHQQYKQY